VRGEPNIFKNWYQLGEFHHLYDELRKDPTKLLEYCRMLLSAFDYRVQAMTSHFTQLNKFSENNIHGRKTVCYTEVSPTCYTFNAHYSFL